MSHKLLKIYDGRCHFWQWDKGQRLIILDDSITAVHLSHKGESSSQDAAIKTENNMRVCDIPDVFLQIPKNLIVYVVRSKLNCESTITEVEFAVKLRPQPDGYMSVHDDEYSDIDGRISTLEELVGDGITVDGELDEMSENPVQNKVVFSEVNNLNQGLYVAIATAQSAINKADEAYYLAESAGREGHNANAVLDNDVMPRLNEVEGEVDALQERIDNLKVDDKLSSESTNPVQNKVVFDQIREIGQIVSNVRGELNVDLKPRLTAVETTVEDLDKNRIIVDGEVLEGSNNPVSGNAVVQYVDDTTAQIGRNVSNNSDNIETLKQTAPPAVTTSDNGKLLQVVGGKWHASNVEVGISVTDDGDGNVKIETGDICDTDDETAVLYIPQTLTEEQKAQTRENIGAGVGEVTYSDLIAKPTNLFNEDTLLVGYTINTNAGARYGIVYASSGYKTTDIIPAEPNTEYVASKSSSDGSRVLSSSSKTKVFAYDENDICLGHGDNPYLTPDNTAYIRVTMPTSYHTPTNEYQVEAAKRNAETGEIELAPYERYGEYGSEAVREFKAELLKEVQKTGDVWVSVSEDDTIERIGEILSAARGSVLFPKGKAFTIDNTIVVSGASNVTIDFNGCTFTRTGSPGGKPIAMFQFTDCQNIVLKNGIFDADAWDLIYDPANEIYEQCIVLYLPNCHTTIKNCEFKNSNDHYVYVQNGYCVGENITFRNLKDTDTSSDVYVACDSNSYVETHWRNITSTRTEYSNQVFYFGVTDDTQKVFHTVDGLWANNTVQACDLRGGEGYFRNVYVENTLGIITQRVGKTTNANAPIVTCENFHLKNAGKSLPAIINILAGRRVRMKNILIESPNWELNEGSTDYRRVIEVSSNNYPVRDVVIEDVLYTGDISTGTQGVSVPHGVLIHGNVECTLNDITINTEIKNVGIGYSGYTTKVDEKDVNITPSLEINNFKCGNKTVALINSAGKVVTDVNAIRMSNNHRSIGTTDERPELFPCETHMYYDTTLNKPVFWNGTTWCEM